VAAKAGDGLAPSEREQPKNFILFYQSWWVTEATGHPPWIG